MDDQPVSNYDLLKRIEAMEEQLQILLELFEQGKGALNFLKWLGGLGVGVAVIASSFSNWWHK